MQAALAPVEAHRATCWRYCSSPPSSSPAEGVFKRETELPLGVWLLTRFLTSDNVEIRPVVGGCGPAGCVQPTVPGRGAEAAGAVGAVAARATAVRQSSRGRGLLDLRC